MSQPPGGPFAAVRVGVLRRLLLLVALGPLWLLAAGTAGADTEDYVRIRLAWGSGDGGKHRWIGQATVSDGTLSHLQPLGIESDAAVAIRLEENTLMIDPLEKRGFDGCDVNIAATPEAVMRVAIRSEQATQETVVEVPLEDVVAGHVRHRIDDSGGFLLAYRSPGDQLRLITERDHLVFNPGDKWPLRLRVDLGKHLAIQPVGLELTLRRVGSGEILWQSTQALDQELRVAQEVEFEVECPEREGAYQLTVAAKGEEGLTTRFVPGQRPKPLASREVEFVVIDHHKKLVRIVDEWSTVLSINPANPSWWQRLPSWAQLQRISGKTTGSFGNCRLTTRTLATGEVVELPASTGEGDPAWQCYTLPVQALGAPHAVEIEFPLSEQQHLSVAIVEPDAAGRVTTAVPGMGIHVEEVSSTGNDKMGMRRLVFWPRTRTPQLLLVNRHPTLPATYGKITLKRHNNAAGASDGTSSLGYERLIAGYLAQPNFAQNFGGAEVLDSTSGMSVQGWSTFLEAATRMAQFLRFDGYNALVISVAADGSALYPSDLLRPTPRHDTGMLAASGQDPLRKDVLEALLQVCDREGIRVVPTIELATPLPRLEELRRASDSRNSGVAWVDQYGRSWNEVHRRRGGAAPHYNLLNREVQLEIIAVAAELTQRYQHHPSFAGIAIQLAGNGYGVLPGLDWGFDDTTAAAFSRDNNLELSTTGDDRFGQRARLLLGEYRPFWQQWRAEKLTAFYQELSETVRGERADAQLFLATENLFTGPALEQVVRKSAARPERLGKALVDHGLNLSSLASIPGVVVTMPHRLGAGEVLAKQAADLTINAAAHTPEFLPASLRTAALFHHTSERFRLSSFDEQSPFGASQTHLLLANQPTLADRGKRRLLINAIAEGKLPTVLEGGGYLPLEADGDGRRIRRTMQQLPLSETDVRTMSKQPLVMRLARTSEATYLIAINNSPWPLEGRLPVVVSEKAAWTALGSDRKTGSPREGEPPRELAEGSNDWKFQLQAYDMLAWRVETTQLRISEPEFTLESFVREDLERRIREIELRAGNLNIQRSYPELQNPGFELGSSGEGIHGWQPRRGLGGSVEVVSTQSSSGNHSLRMQSADTTGVAIESHLFPMPETGQLSMRLHLKGETIGPDTALYVLVEDSEGGGTYQRYMKLGNNGPLPLQWTRYEIAFDDLPLGVAGQLRIQLLLTGVGDVLIDDLELFDLRFDDARRGEMVKRMYAAKTALEDEQVVDCLRLLNEHWSRYLVAHVPPVERTAVSVAEQPKPPAVKEEEPRTSMGDRLRGWVPRVWR